MNMEFWLGRFASPSLVLLASFVMLVATDAQGLSPPAPPDDVELIVTYALENPCAGVILHYQIQEILKVPSTLQGPKKPHGFRSRIQLLNAGKRDMDDWSILIGYKRDEMVTSLANTQVDPDLPAPGKGLVFSSIPGASDVVLTAVNSGGDVSQYVVTAKVNGTLFGVSNPGDALPISLQLLNAGYSCVSVLGKPSPSSIAACCREGTFSPPPPPQRLLQEPEADVEVVFDATWVGPSEHWFLVSILNKQLLRRIEAPGWELSWRWNKKEIIWEMKGAQATESGNCAAAAAAELYGAGIQNAHSCDPQPSIIDLPPDAYDSSSYPDATAFNTLLACCKNGTLGMATFPLGDPAFSHLKGNASVAQFRMKVGRVKMSRLNFIRDVAPPSALSLGLQGFNCSAPVKMPMPTPFVANPERNLSAAATWKYYCSNVSRPLAPPCCVSFSAFYNHTPSTGTRSSWLFGNWLSAFNGPGPLYVSPCASCACGCPRAPIPSGKLSVNAGRLRPQVQALVSWNSSNQCPARGQTYDDVGTEGDLVPMHTWRDRPALSARCKDNCPVHLHWHVSDFYPGGWLAKMTIVNRDVLPVVDWFAALKLDALDNLTAVYSFNKFSVNASFVLVWGYESTNDWLLGSTPGANTFGNVKSIIQFGRNSSFVLTNSTARRLFPTRVIFGGQSCSLPLEHPAFSPKPPSRMPISVAYIGLIAAVIFIAVLSYGMLV